MTHKTVLYGAVAVLAATLARAELQAIPRYDGVFASLNAVSANGELVFVGRSNGGSVFDLSKRTASPVSAVDETLGTTRLLDNALNKLAIDPGNLTSCGIAFQNLNEVFILPCDLQGLLRVQRAENMTRWWENKVPGINVEDMQWLELPSLPTSTYSDRDTFMLEMSREGDIIVAGSQGELTLVRKSDDGNWESAGSLGRHDRVLGFGATALFLANDNKDDGTFDISVRRRDDGWKVATSITTGLTAATRVAVDRAAEKNRIAFKTTSDDTLVVMDADAKATEWSSREITMEETYELLSLVGDRQLAWTAMGAGMFECDLDAESPTIRHLFTLPAPSKPRLERKPFRTGVIGPELTVAISLDYTSFMGIDGVFIYNTAAPLPIEPYETTALGLMVAAICGAALAVALALFRVPWAAHVATMLASVAAFGSLVMLMLLVASAKAKPSLYELDALIVLESVGNSILPGLLIGVVAVFFVLGVIRVVASRAEVQAAWSKSGLSARAKAAMSLVLVVPSAVLLTVAPSGFSATLVLCGLPALDSSTQFWFVLLELIGKGALLLALVKGPDYERWDNSEWYDHLFFDISPFDDPERQMVVSVSIALGIDIAILFLQSSLCARCVDQLELARKSWCKAPPAEATVESVASSEHV